MGAWSQLTASERRRQRRADLRVSTRIRGERFAPGRSRALLCNLTPGASPARRQWRPQTRFKRRSRSKELAASAVISAQAVGGPAPSIMEDRLVKLRHLAPLAASVALTVLTVVERDGLVTRAE